MKKRSNTKILILSAFLMLILLGGCETTEGAEYYDMFMAVTEVVADNELIQSFYPEAAMIADSANKVGSAFEEFTPENEYFIGRSVAGAILTHYSLANTPDMNRYLTTIANSLGSICQGVSQPLKGYFVAVLDSSEINAFATAGGHIFITRGFIEAMETEDQMAAVIAHEMSHIQLKHGLNTIKNSRSWDAVTSVASTGYYFASEDKQKAKQILDTFESTLGPQTDALLVSGYSKNNEFDADNHAVLILNAAGYNPEALEEMLNLINTADANAGLGLGKTHPKPADRIKKLQKTYKKLSPVSTDSVRTARFLEHKVLLAAR